MHCADEKRRTKFSERSVEDAISWEMLQLHQDLHWVLVSAARYKKFPNKFRDTGNLTIAEYVVKLYILAETIKTLVKSRR